MLPAEHDFRSTKRFDRTALQENPLKLGIVAAVAQPRLDARLVARRATEQVNVATEGRLTELTGIARAAIDHQRLDRVRRKKGVAVVSRVVLVAERHPVVGDVVFAVLEAPDLRFGFAQSRPVGTAVIGNAG